MHRLLAAAAVAALIGPAVAQPAAGVAPPQPALAAPAPAKAAPGAPRTIGWDQLVPRDWDPMKEFKDLDLAGLADGDPRANKLLQRMREIWDAAPANPAIVGQAVRLPGFVVPLEETKQGLKEFLLVPYFGACIHSPPPPANQIVHVFAARPVAFKSMDTVWVSGTLATVRGDTYMGASSYRIDGAAVERYTEKAR
ncbi:DUF3299 domain-containing protein [Rubrivivax benzoatilyticus]|uniref:DUF3299 domain-containing protein n=1 Tax=Rubrivivax benzoatilyticus TaxID=316997 RepID=A0ABX0HPJ3_9BURK|nr:DUF3299 domain-containing protein [Rubrivivax benzoatilyticus]EGJ12065.1 hypothetical protein RBXJA2T_17122 [Rubrivivax benzoatilyticus JA2 = ATCC BAA-35]NHK96989.1 DUF3299 domain-containing protein [Rubrivivax benzoatilyticus]NHL24704.1 DUF3299 domain-containing protein [Rubrivivax benzoatilyticus]